MRKAVRAIIIKERQLLVMHRNKFGKEYETLPGGNIAMGESPEAALVREISEETSLVFSNPKLVFIERVGQPWGDQYIFKCEYVHGEPKLGVNTEEALINKLGHNLYQPQWLDIDTLPSVAFKSENLKAALMKAIADNWSAEAIEIFG